MQYRRAFAPGGTFFFTVVTYQRCPIFSTPQAVEYLRQALRYTLQRMPFTFVASVILPDHLHFIWTLPSGDSDFSTRWRLIKSHFTRHWHYGESQNKSISRQLKGEQGIWQRRFWEHLIRNDNDLARHIEYIHYNPVKHGLAKSPAEWQYSSFMQFVKNGIYPLDWSVDEKLLNEIHLE
jgi:putative transposase